MVKECKEWQINCWRLFFELWCKQYVINGTKMANLDEYRVLITASGSSGVPGLISDLRLSGERFFIVTVDINEDAIGNLFADKSYVVPAWDDSSYITSILEIVEKEDIKYLIPNDGFEGLVKLCQLKKHNNKLRIAVTRNLEHLSIAADKSNLYNYLLSNKMGNYVPSFSLVEDKDTLLSKIKNFGCLNEGVAIKPSLSEGSRGFNVVKKCDKNIFEERGMNSFLSLDELEFYLRRINKIPKMLVMEYLPGEEYSVDVLMSENGKIEYIVPRVREQISNGLSIRGVVKKNLEIEEMVVSILHVLPLEYAINIQIKYSKDRKPKIIEINPRVSGSMTFCTGAGVNMHYFLILLLADKLLPKVDLIYGTRMQRYYKEIYLHA